MTVKLILKNLLAETVTISGGSVTGDKAVGNLLKPDTDLTYGSSTRVNIDFTANQEMDGLIAVHPSGSAGSVRWILQDNASPRSELLNQTENLVNGASFTFLDDSITGVRRILIDPVNPCCYLIAGSIIEPSVPPLLGDGLEVPIANTPLVTQAGQAFILYGQSLRSGTVRWSGLSDSESEMIYEGVRFALKRRSLIGMAMFEGDSDRQEMGRMAARITGVRGPTRRRTGNWSIDLVVMEVGR